MSRQFVYLVDDDASVRDALRTLLELNHIATRVFPSGEAMLGELAPDWSGCFLLDLKMPGRDGLDVQQELLRRGVALPVVIMTAHGDVATVRAALKAGAFDFLEKPVDPDVLIDVVRSVLDLEETRRRRQQERAWLEGKAQRLTNRERQVMEQLAQGRQHREIAALLGISPRTVEVYKARMMEKLDARTLADVFSIHARLNDPAA